MKSPLVHHVGWSQTSGHKLHATQGQYLSMYRTNWRKGLFDQIKKNINIKNKLN
jgi:hypothetical protein